MKDQPIDIMSPMATEGPVLMNRKKGQEFKDTAEKHGITAWLVHNCSVCNYPCGYVIPQNGPYKGRVGYDSGCDCVNYGPIITERTWDDLAAHYNAQTYPRTIAEMDRFWHFSTEVLEKGGAMKFDVKNRWTGNVKFTAEIEADDNTSLRAKLGLAVRWAYKKGADLKGADLEGAKLKGADLEGADLEGAKLKGADLEGALIAGKPFEVPKIENIHQTIYAAVTATPTALDMSTWHTCETTHCRAGWVVTLAGEAGKKLETLIGTPAAAGMIYWKSDETLKQRPDFYCDNQTALADMKKRAGEEAARGKQVS